MYLRNILLGAAVATTGAVAAQAEGHMQTASAQVAGNSDDISGTVSLNTTASGRTLVKIDVTGVPAGTPVTSILTKVRPEAVVFRLTVPEISSELPAT